MTSRLRRVCDRLYPALAVIDTALATTRGPRGRLRRVTKSALMPLLLPRVAGDARATTAVLASWAGDVALLESDRPVRFVAGAGSFAVAHAAYLAAFGDPRQWGDPRRWDAQAWSTVAVSAVATPVVAGAARRSPVPAGVAVVYASVLTSMTLAALSRRGEQHGRERALGACLFLASDTALGVRTFVVTDRDTRTARVLDGVVMATYTAAQALLTTGRR